MSDERDLDLVVFGATSFVGDIVCGVLRAHPELGRLRWAIAGRDAAKLEAVAERHGLDRAERLIVDAHDTEALATMCGRSRSVITTVGPYTRYGSPLVAAAVAAGTDVCDLTGEPPWMRDMIERHHEQATRTGARIVHTCGFDSIPSDLGVWHLQQAAIEAFGEPCVRVGLRVEEIRGSASGGTIASMLTMLEELAADPSLRHVMSDPYALWPAAARIDHPMVDQPDVLLPTRDDLSGQWVAPFVMAGVNTKVVHRSHALLGLPWGEEFRYDEAMAMGAGPAGLARAGAMSGGLGAALGAVAVPPVRGLLKRFVLPKPGDGPSPAAQEAGGFDLALHGRTALGDRITTRVTGDRDPGYGSTARMLAESAGTLLTTDRSTTPGGFWTPASAMAQPLMAALEARAGLTFDVLET